MKSKAGRTSPSRVWKSVTYSQKTKKSKNSLTSLKYSSESPTKTTGTLWLPRVAATLCMKSPKSSQWENTNKFFSSMLSPSTVSSGSTSVSNLTANTALKTSPSTKFTTHTLQTKSISTVFPFPQNGWKSLTQFTVSIRKRTRNSNINWTWARRKWKISYPQLEVPTKRNWHSETPFWKLKIAFTFNFLYWVLSMNWFF